LFEVNGDVLAYTLSDTVIVLETKSEMFLTKTRGYQDFSTLLQAYRQHLFAQLYTCKESIDEEGTLHDSERD